MNRRTLLVFALLVIVSVVLVFAGAYISTGGRLFSTQQWPVFEEGRKTGIPVFLGSRQLTTSDGIGISQEVRSYVSPFATWYRFYTDASPGDVSVFYNTELTRLGYKQELYQDNLQVFSKNGQNLILYIIVINGTTNYVIAT
jgi:hypothetical protein